MSEMNEETVKFSSYIAVHTGWTVTYTDVGVISEPSQIMRIFIKNGVVLHHLHVNMHIGYRAWNRNLITVVQSTSTS